MHLVCGGGTGSSLMRELTDRGYEVSAGVLNALDSDEVTGRELGLSMAVEAPFAPIGDDAHAENLRIMSRRRRRRARRRALGHGNAATSTPCSRRARAGTPVWVAAAISGENDPAAANRLGGASLCRYDDEREALQGLDRQADDGRSGARAGRSGPERAVRGRADSRWRSGRRKGYRSGPRPGHGYAPHCGSVCTSQADLPPLPRPPPLLAEMASGAEKPLELFDQGRQIIVHGIPDLLVVDVEIPMHDAMAHADHGGPRHAGERCAPVSGHVVGGLADHAEVAEQSEQKLAVRVEVVTSSRR